MKEISRTRFGVFAGRRLEPAGDCLHPAKLVCWARETFNPAPFLALHEGPGESWGDGEGERALLVDLGSGLVVQTSESLLPAFPQRNPPRPTKHTSPRWAAGHLVGPPPAPH